MNPSAENMSAIAMDRRKLLAGILCCSAAGLAAWRKPNIKIDHLGNQKLEQIVPKTIGRWQFESASGLVVPPEDQLLQALYSQLLTRVYWDGQSSPIMLLMAQSGSQTGFLQVHRPETCYIASGYRISDVNLHPIKTGSGIIQASTMDATTGGPTEHVVFWTRVGDEMPTSWKKQKLAVAEQNLRGIIPDAILVRISLVWPNGEEARETIDNFVRSLLESIPASSRAVFVA